MSKKSARVFAPASTGNVGVGFDILGLALDATGDTVTATKIDSRGTVEIEKIDGVELPLDPERNTASAGVIKLLSDMNAPFGVRLKIKKGIPIGSGMGGSAASAVAGVVAVNALLKKPFPREKLLDYALIGEMVATGSLHGDNVAPCLFGGLVLVRSTEPALITRVPFPSQIKIVIALPNVRVDTRDARAVLSPDVPLKKFVGQSARLAGFIAGCYGKDIKLLTESFEDLIIEPQRAKLIPGFNDVKAEALKHGALGCTISGAGPAVFALSKAADANKIKSAMTKAFIEAGVGPVKAWVSSVNKRGAYLL